MGKTFAEKMLALKSGKESVVTGEIVTVSPDIVMSHDNTAAIARKFKQIGIDKVLHFVEFDPANAIKATIVRPVDSGSIGETDVYGAQQHAPLLEIKIPYEE